MECNNKSPRETGGVIIGNWLNKKEIFISNLVGPGPNAKHFLNSFFPDHEYQVKAIEKLFYESFGNNVYLGDWHTHPIAKPYLSNTDLKTLKAILNYEPAKLSKPLMLIYSPLLNNIKGWTIEKKGILNLNKVNECTIVKINN